MLFKFEIQDTGIGIPRDRMSRLFQSFSQVDASTTRRFGGTGLGLAICKQLAELMGGRIGVESVEGKGSTFWFTARLHVRADHPTASAPISDGCRLPYVKSKGVRVLLVEDQEINCIVAAELLTEAGFAHDIVHDGKTALDAVINGNYQLVLMDCQMPGMDGLEASRHIRRHERENLAKPRVPIIALTANTSGTLREECIAAGMDGFCSKPFNTRQLFDAIARALKDVPPAPDASTPYVPPPPASAATSPPFELQTVLNRCSGKAALAALVLDKFESQAIDALVKIQSHAAAGDADELARASHAIKGTAGTLGANSLQSIAGRLEEMGRARDIALAKDAIEHLRVEVQRCVTHIQAVRTTLTASQATTPETVHGRVDR
jgi:CheY-like chemotaxis protein/HPt (histidine-containing phosphotransfer) domain-containing protein